MEWIAFSFSLQQVRILKSCSYWILHIAPVQQCFIYWKSLYVSFKMFFNRLPSFCKVTLWFHNVLYYTYYFFSHFCPNLLHYYLFLLNFINYCYNYGLQRARIDKTFTPRVEVFCIHWNKKDGKNNLVQALVKIAHCLYWYQNNTYCDTFLWELFTCFGPNYLKC